jgi:hypothetical protein
VPRSGSRLCGIDDRERSGLDVGEARRTRGAVSCDPYGVSEDALQFCESLVGVDHLDGVHAEGAG